MSQFRPVCFIWLFLYGLSVVRFIDNPYFILSAFVVYAGVGTAIPKLLGKRRWMRFSSLEWMKLTLAHPSSRDTEGESK